MARGGKRIGAGKPKGYVHRQTREREAELRRFRERAMAHADELFDAQLTLALGSVLFFRIDETGTGKNKRRVHTHITDADEIKSVLDAAGGDEGEKKIGNKFYIVTIVPPDNKAIDSMLDRTFGKSTLPVELPPSSPEVIAAAEKLLLTLSSLNILDNDDKVSEAIEVAARIRKLPVEALEREVKGFLETRRDENGVYQSK